MDPIFPWQLQNWLHLCDYRAQQRIPQALLITGNSGLGKRQLAEQFAYSLLCSLPEINGLSCGHCDGCLLIKAGTHPDLIRIKPVESGKEIGIGLIRAAIADTSLKPQYEAYRVVIVDPADQMSTSAANAFLKCLEEPNERTVFLLVSDRPAKLAATIISRCQKLTVEPPAKEALFSWLKQQNIENDLETLAALSQNSPLLALQYAKEQTLALRHDCFNAWLAVWEHRANPVAVAENWMKFAHSELLFWLTSWIIDLIRCFYQSKPGNFYNPDFLLPLQEMAVRLDLKGLYQFYDLLLVCRQKLDTQINKQLMLEEILIRWSFLNRRT